PRVGKRSQDRAPHIARQELAAGKYQDAEQPEGDQRKQQTFQDDPAEFHGRRLHPRAAVMRQGISGQCRTRSEVSKLFSASIWRSRIDPGRRPLSSRFYLRTASLAVQAPEQRPCCRHKITETREKEPDSSRPRCWIRPPVPPSGHGLPATSTSRPMKNAYGGLVPQNGSHPRQLSGFPSCILCRESRPTAAGAGSTLSETESPAAEDAKLVGVTR